MLISASTNTAPSTNNMINSYIKVFEIVVSVFCFGDSVVFIVEGKFHSILVSVFYCIQSAISSSKWHLKLKFTFTRANTKQQNHIIPTTAKCKEENDDDDKINCHVTTRLAHSIDINTFRHNITYGLTMLFLQNVKQNIFFFSQTKRNMKIDTTATPPLFCCLNGNEKWLDSRKSHPNRITSTFCTSGCYGPIKKTHIHT